MSSDSKVKVEFRVDPYEQCGVKTESLWAESVGPRLFRILNSPFFLFGISADDVVEAEETEGALKFRRVASRGGHSTYRIFLQNGRTIKDRAFQDYWEPISKLGATFENADAISPPSTFHRGAMSLQYIAFSTEGNKTASGLLKRFITQERPSCPRIVSSDSAAADNAGEHPG